MRTIIFDKTDKGREEIATRKYQLAPRLRTLLVLVDGKQNTAELMQKVGGIGLNEQNLAELLENGFIQSVSATPLRTSAEEAPASSTAAPQKSSAQMDTGAQFQALYQFYTETIKSTIGLRGYGLQLKVEKASSIEDLRDLRESYLEAVLKAKGNEMAESLRGRLDQLLAAGTGSRQGKPVAA